MRERSRGACSIPVLICLLCGLAEAPAHGQTPRSLPEPLEAWRQWAVWDDAHRNCPRSWQNAQRRLCFWPSVLNLDADATGARAVLDVTFFADGWLRLPGGQGIWPQAVLANSRPHPILERGQGWPAIRLPAGQHRVECAYGWRELPQRMRMPPEIGIVSLSLAGRSVDFPVWDAQGDLWFRRDDASNETDRDFLSVALHAVLEDGIPLRWQGEIELVVSGKSRQEELGAVLPEGWNLSSVTAPIPVAIDAAGRLKAQVRAGKWNVRFQAFRLSHPETVRFAPDVRPAATEMLVGFRAKPDFRIVELLDIPAVDVSQTAFPSDWRDLPVYRWDTGNAFRMEERMRGMGARSPEGLTIERTLWLDDDGQGLTFRDALSGAMHTVWRLDAAPGQELGSVRASGEGLLITRNPQTGAPGVELRMRDVQLEAVGRMARGRHIPASGWMTHAESIDTTLHLPPGYRLLALWGADWVNGDWLTAWTLMDLFLLLIFTLAVTRLWGLAAGALAFVAFGLSYHEPGAPRAVWLLLLMPVALLRAAGPGARLRPVLTLWKWIMTALLVLQLTPFAAQQVQQSLYPQLERVRSAAPVGRRSGRAAARQPGRVAVEAAPFEERAAYDRAAPALAASAVLKRARSVNLMQDAKAQIQTGPGIPAWTWRGIRFGWSGPVDPSQRVRLILIPLAMERAFGVARVVLAVGLAVLLLQARRGKPVRGTRRASPAAACALGLLCFGALPAMAQFPDADMLDTLRARLLDTPDAFPGAADIPSMDLAINGNRLAMTVEVHVAARCAVPLPGKLPAWSPVNARTSHDASAILLRREDGHLWTLLEEGIHRVQIEGLLPAVSEWELSFLLRPRRLVVAAPEWAVSGISSDGVPEAQVLFVRLQREGRGEASYEHQEFQPMVALQRELELGIVWQARTTVRRLSPPGRALALHIPLLPGENVLTAGAIVKDGCLDVRLAAGESEFAWTGEIHPVDRLNLDTQRGNPWAEQWVLLVSPVWNVSSEGLDPVFDVRRNDLTPTWTPWPGESVRLHITRPQAVSGVTMTLHDVKHDARLGLRQRSARLEMSVQASLGQEFAIELPQHAEVTELTVDGEDVPVRRHGRTLALAVRPATQTVGLGYRTAEALGFRARMPEVRLPLESANVNLSLHLPENRWLLWARGPLLGPAVRFWGVLAVALLGALVLGRLPRSPLNVREWMLLAVGLTQVPLPAALAVVAWLFLLEWRGRTVLTPGRPFRFNLLQAGLAALTLAVLGVLVAAVAAGLLGQPEMFVIGNGSTRTVLRWYQARSGSRLPQPALFSVSIWWYRLLMLLWALWLAMALLRWLRWGWAQFSRGGCFRKGARASRTVPPPLPPPAV